MIFDFILRIHSRSAYSSREKYSLSEHPVLCTISRHGFDDAIIHDFSCSLIPISESLFLLNFHHVIERNIKPDVLLQESTRPLSLESLFPRQYRTELRLRDCPAFLV